MKKDFRITVITEKLRKTYYADIYDVEGLTIDQKNNQIIIHSADYTTTQIPLKGKINE